MNYSLEKFQNNVYHAYKKDTKIDDIMVKQYYCEDLFYREKIALLIMKDHPRIPQLINAQYPYIIMKKLPGECLIDMLEESRKIFFDEKEIKNIVYQLVQIVKSIHDQDIIHRDIKPDNILYDKKTKTVYLIDFDRRVTQQYAAPENLKDPYMFHPKNDVWGVGIIAYILITGSYPWHPRSNGLKSDYFSLQKYPKSTQEIISRMLCKNYKDRISLKDLLNHDWFNK